MQIAIFGLGKMGAQIARRLHVNNFEVLAWNRSESPRLELQKSGVKVFSTVEEVVKNMSEQPRVFWLMVLQEAVDEFLEKQLGPYLRPGDIVIDGGNSFYKDTIRRANELAKKQVVFYDCGTSGGIWGEKWVCFNDWWK